MLTDVQIRSFQPQAQAYRVADGDGLFVNVAPSGERNWVFRYKLAGRSGSIGLGPLSQGGAEGRPRAPRPGVP
jgi:Arm DNA-binding domain